MSPSARPGTALAFLVVASLALAGCSNSGGGGDSTPSVPPAIAPVVEFDTMDFSVQESVGTVRAVHESGPHQMFEIALEGGGLAFVPVLRTHVLAVDPPRGVDVRPGALAELS